MPNRDSKRSSRPDGYAGVPLGGIGAGCIEIGQDACFRNVTTNNNRTASSRFEVASGAFVGVRATRGADPSTCILQPETSVAFSEAGLKPRHAHPKEFSWYGLYPTSNHRFVSKAFPLEVQWSSLSPVIPYDTEASTLPLIMSALQFTNHTEHAYTISGLMNWENLRGCTVDERPSDRGRVGKVYYVPQDKTLETKPPSGAFLEPDPPVVAGLTFGLDEPCTLNEEGNYCLSAYPAPNTRISYASWRKDDPEDVRSVWESFEKHGWLSDRMSTEPDAHCGAICATTHVEPGETRRILFLLSWYFPVYVVHGEDLGNAYAVEHQDSVAVSAYGLKHSKYFHRAVSNWQQRFLQSSFPSWYSRMLINSCSVFSTNTLLTRDEEFAMMESPQGASMGMLDRSFYSSIGTLLFYPGFAERELEMFSKTEGEGQVYRELGKGTMREGGHGNSLEPLVELNAVFILLVYRNFHLSGRTATLVELYPRLREAMEYGLGLDQDDDGLPEVSGDSTTFGGWAIFGLSSYVGGLWLAALSAYANLMRHLKHAEEAERYEARAARALRFFEHRLWMEKEGYYRLYLDTRDEASGHPRADSGCHSGQLAGAWYSDFLNLGVGFSHDRIVRTLDAIEQLDGRSGGIAKGYSPEGEPCTNPPSYEADPETNLTWPFHVVSNFACPQIYHGEVDKGLDTLRSIYQEMHVKRHRTFNQPLAWDPDLDRPAGSPSDRHMGALSIWHSLFALQGFSMSIPEQRIRISPNLPEGVNHLAAPLFLPVAFGWLTYQMVSKPSYRQEVRITFESPVFIKLIELSVPKSLTVPKVVLLIDEDPAPIKTSLVKGELENRLLVALDDPLKVQHPIEVRVE